MTEPKLTYLGPTPAQHGEHLKTAKPSIWSRMPKSFLIVVVLPTLITAIYFLFIATPRYVSEARFIVRAAEREQQSPFGVALQGVGLSSTTTDAFAVHEYIKSRDGLAELQRRYNLRAILAPSHTDLFSRYPRPWEAKSDEGLFKAFGRYVTVGYDSTTGISTLRVQAFRASEARDVANALLDGGEGLVNRLNDRAGERGVSEAQQNLREAEERLTVSQRALAEFRNRERFIDPGSVASAGADLIGGLAVTVATLRAERDQINRATPNSPQLPALDGRIAAFERQIAAERLKIVGSTDSLAPKIGIYENLSLDRELADKSVGAARTSLDSAMVEARRQRLYLERVVNPNLPDEPSQPKPWTAIFTVLATLLLAYATGWLIVSGIREHKQG